MKIDPYLSSFTKFNSERIKDFNTRPDTLNLIEESVENRLRWTGTGKEFLDKILITQVVSTINKWELLKLKSFCTAKEGHYHPSKMEAYRMGGNLYQLYVC